MNIKELRYELILTFLGKEFNKYKIEKFLSERGIHCTIIRNRNRNDCDYIICIKDIDKNILVKTGIVLNNIEDILIEN